jgi:hypothetical protein
MGGVLDIQWGYPLAYFVMVLPLSIARWLQFSKFNIQGAAGDRRRRREKRGRRKGNK